LESTIKKQITLELLWWLVTAIVAAAILYPIVSSLDNYPFFTSNLVFIVVFITLTRYVFLLKHTILAKAELIKVGIVLVSVPFIFLLIEGLSNFQNYLDEEGLDKFMPLMNLDKQQDMINYIKSEMIFFGVGAIIVAVLFPFRMIISIWKNRNSNKT
jgi:uncharacterized membrane protein YcfT